MKRRKRKFHFERLLILLVVGALIICIGILLIVKKDANEDNKSVLKGIVDSTAESAGSFYYKDGLMYFDNENYESITGIDVSEYQHEIDWNAVKNDGIDFVMIRCGFRGAEGGVLYEDEMYRDYIQGALDVGLDVGIYFFSSALTDEEIEEEVEFVDSLISDYDISYPIAYDMEYYENGRILSLSIEEKTRFAKYFCDAFNEKGYQTLIYGNKNWLENNLDIQSLYKNYDFWYAAYIEKPELNYPFVMWQYTSEGIVNGIDTNVDIDLYVKKKVE